MDSDDYIEKYGFDRWNKLDEKKQYEMIKRKMDKIKKSSEDKIKKAFLTYLKKKDQIDSKICEIKHPLYLLIANDVIITGGTFDKVYKKRQEFDENAVILPIPINSSDEYWTRNTQKIIDRTLKGFAKVDENKIDYEHKIPPKIYHPISFDDNISKIPSNNIELQWDTGADFTRIATFGIAYVSSQKLNNLGNVSVYGHKLGNDDIYPVYELRLSSLEGGSFGWVRILVGGNDGVMGRDLGFCFKQKINPVTNPPTIIFKRIHQQPLYYLFKNIPFPENEKEVEGSDIALETLNEFMDEILKEM